MRRIRSTIDRSSRVSCGRSTRFARCDVLASAHRRHENSAPGAKLIRGFAVHVSTRNDASRTVYGEPNFSDRFFSYVGRSLTTALSAASPSPAPSSSAAAEITGAAPAIFAPGIVSGPANDGSPSFTPDGKTLFFTRSGTSVETIMESHLRGDAWSPPEIAPFSGIYNDEHTVVAPDGSYLIFVSTRPVAGDTKKGARIWRADRSGDEWGTPAPLPAAVNLGTYDYAPSLAADGSIYFLSIGEHRAFQLYRSKFINGRFQQAEKLSFSSPATADVDPMIARDQSYLVFSSSGRRTADDKQEHLYITYNQNGAWSTVMPMHYESQDSNGSSNDNEPELSPDGKTIYFSSDRSTHIALPRTRAQAEDDLARISLWDNGNTNVWSMPIAPWLQPTA